MCVRDTDTETQRCHTLVVLGTCLGDPDRAWLQFQPQTHSGGHLEAHHVIYVVLALLWVSGCPPKGKLSLGREDLRGGLKNQPFKKPFAPAYPIQGMWGVGL